MSSAMNNSFYYGVGVAGVLAGAVVIYSVFQKALSEKEENPIRPVKQIHRYLINETKEAKERQAMNGVVIQDKLTAIDCAKILEKDPVSLKQVVQNLRKHGYTLIKLTTEVVLAARTLEQTGKRYFAQSNEEKDKNKDVDNGNVGYVRIDGLREYIKLRPTDPEQLWPTLPSFKSAFDSFYNTNKAIVWNCFVGLAHHLEELDGRVLLKPEELAAIEEFVHDKSNVSLIHYFPQDFENSLACDEHRDSGLLTAIVKTGVPSLQVWDKHHKKYLKIEEMVQDDEMIVFMGEKVPLFCATNVFTGTPHRVVVPANNVERYSMAFLLDVAK